MGGQLLRLEATLDVRVAAQATPSRIQASRRQFLPSTYASMFASVRKFSGMTSSGRTTIR